VQNTIITNVNFCHITFRYFKYSRPSNEHWAVINGVARQNGARGENLSAAPYSLQLFHFWPVKLFFNSDWFIFSHLTPLKHYIGAQPRHQDFLVNRAVPINIRASVAIFIQIQVLRSFKDGIACLLFNYLRWKRHKTFLFIEILLWNTMIMSIIILK